MTYIVPLKSKSGLLHQEAFPTHGRIRVRNSLLPTPKIPMDGTRWQKVTLEMSILVLEERNARRKVGNGFPDVVFTTSGRRVLICDTYNFNIYIYFNYYVQFFFILRYFLSFNSILNLIKITNTKLI